MATKEECAAALDQLAEKMGGIDSEERSKNLLERSVSCEIPDLKEFERRWSNQSQAFAVMEPPMYEKLLSDGLPMRVIGRTAGRLMAARQ